MSLYLRQLQTDHANMSRLLRVLDSGLDAVHGSTHADFELMHDVMLYMTNYPDFVHHPREGQIFHRLLDRDPGSQPLLERLAGEHRELAAKGNAFLETLRTVVDGAMVRRDLIESQGRDYMATLRGHMDVEDGEAFPMARAALTEEDWAAVDAAMDEREDPVFGSVVDEQYRALLAYIEQHEQDHGPE